MANKRDRTIAYFRHIATLAVAMGAFTLTLISAVPGKTFVREDLLQNGMLYILGSALAAFVVQTLCVFYCESISGDFRLGFTGGIFGMASGSALVFGIWTLMQFVLLNLPVQSETPTSPAPAAEQMHE
ncbi:MAG: hypothetical protein JSS49_29930 [Planctomycetes bacterium]|nr:hypothetical protein [Planctomycetota bacterium]